MFKDNHQTEMNRPKACLFDLDGVLLNTEPLHGKAWKATAAYFKKNLNEKQLKLLQGRRREDCANQICQWINEEVGLEELLAIHQPISKKLLSNSEAMPGAEALIRWCHENKLPIALVTSSSSKSVNYKTARHTSWINLIPVKVQGDDPELQRGKPAPDPYLLAARKIGVTPSIAWAVEDSISGTKSALEAGCYVWILKDKSEEGDLIKQQLNQSRTKCINELKTLLNILKGIS